MTKMKAFGTGSRIGHDSSNYYARKINASVNPIDADEIVENTIPENALDKIFCKSSEHMGELPDNSVHLMVTSPPYNVGKEYDQNLSLKEYRELLTAVFKEVHRVLVVGGRACVNVANLGRKPYLPLHSFVIEDMMKLDFFMRGEIIWDKASSAGTSMAWGSWLSPTNPSLRDTHEYILVFSKGNNDRLKINGKQGTITKEEFVEYTKSVWTFPAQRASMVNHPAPFPPELPTRLIKLYTFSGDIVLDPFIGSGTSAVAALANNRHYVGYEIDEKYYKIAKKRIWEQTAQTTLIPNI